MSTEPRSQDIRTGYKGKQWEDLEGNRKAREIFNFHCVEYVNAGSERDTKMQSKIVRRISRQLKDRRVMKATSKTSRCGKTLYSKWTLVQGDDRLKFIKERLRDAHRGRSRQTAAAPVPENIPPQVNEIYNEVLPAAMQPHAQRNPQALPGAAAQEVPIRVGEMLPAEGFQNAHLVDIVQPATHLHDRVGDFPRQVVVQQGQGYVLLNVQGDHTPLQSPVLSIYLQHAENSMHADERNLTNHQPLWVGDTQPFMCEDHRNVSFQNIPVAAQLYEQRNLQALPGAAAQEEMLCEQGFQHAHPTDIVHPDGDLNDWEVDVMHTDEEPSAIGRRHSGIISHNLQDFSFEGIP